MTRSIDKFKQYQQIQRCYFPNPGVSRNQVGQVLLAQRKRPRSQRAGWKIVSSTMWTVLTTATKIYQLDCLTWSFQTMRLISDLSRWLENLDVMLLSAIAGVLDNNTKPQQQLYKKGKSVYSSGSSQKNLQGGHSSNSRIEHQVSLDRLALYSTGWSGWLGERSISYVLSISECTNHHCGSSIRLWG